MGSVPLHPAIVHLPLGIATIIPLLALVAAFALWRGKAARKTWSVIVALQAVLLLGGFVAAKSGEREEERAEAVVAESAIHRHEEAAEAFMLGAGIALAVAGAVLVLPARLAAYGAFATAALMIGVLGLGIRAGHAGGELVYVHNAGAAYSDTAAARSARASADAGDEAGRARRGRDERDDDGH